MRDTGPRARAVYVHRNAAGLHFSSCPGSASEAAAVDGFGSAAVTAEVRDVLPGVLRAGGPAVPHAPLRDASSRGAVGRRPEVHARCWVRAGRPTAARVGTAASADLTGPASAAPQAWAHAAVDSGTSLSEQAPPRSVFPRSDACRTSRLGAVNVGGATRSLVLLLYVPRFVFFRQIPPPETRRFFLGSDLLGSLMPPVLPGSPVVLGRCRFECPRARLVVTGPASPTLTVTFIRDERFLNRAAVAVRPRHPAADIQSLSVAGCGRYSAPRFMFLRRPALRSFAGRSPTRFVTGSASAMLP